MVSNLVQRLDQLHRQYVPFIQLRHQKKSNMHSRVMIYSESHIVVDCSTQLGAYKS